MANGFAVERGSVVAYKEQFMSTNIFIVDDHTEIAHLLSKYLNRLPGLAVCGIAASGEEALDQLPKLAVDLVLIDLSLPDIRGDELVKKLLVCYPDLPCLILSGYLNEELVQAALSAGARGYLVKINPAEFPEAIQRALNNEIYLSPKVRMQLPHVDNSYNKTLHTLALN